MATVKDYMDKNDNVRVLIDLTPDMEKLYDGMLYDIPEELQQLKVVSEGWLMGEQCNNLSVIKEKEYVIEIKEQLARTVKIQAASEEEALKKVEEKYYSGEIILNADDMKSYDIEPYHKYHMTREKEQEDRTL